MNKEKSKTGIKLSYLIIGGGIGAILALLFAPKAGEELRSDIADATRKGLDKTEEMATHLGEKASTIYEDTKTKAAEIYDSAKQKIISAETAISEIPENLQNAVHDKIGQISATIEAGKEEYEREEIFLGDKTKGKAN